MLIAGRQNTSSRRLAAGRTGTHGSSTNCEKVRSRSPCGFTINSFRGLLTIGPRGSICPFPPTSIINPQENPMTKKATKKTGAKRGRPTKAEQEAKKAAAAQASSESSATAQVNSGFKKPTSQQVKTLVRRLESLSSQARSA